MYHPPIPRFSTALSGEDIVEVLTERIVLPTPSRNMRSYWHHLAILFRLLHRRATAEQTFRLLLLVACFGVTTTPWMVLLRCLPAALWIRLLVWWELHKRVPMPPMNYALTYQDAEWLLVLLPLMSTIVDTVCGSSSFIEAFVEHTEKVLHEVDMHLASDAEE